MAKKTKYNKTNYPNIFWYETAKGKRYHIRRGYKIDGKKKEATKSNLKSIPEARKALAEIEQKIDNNDFDYNKNLTVNQYWDIYSELQVKRGIWAPDTEYGKQSIYKNHFKDWLGNVKMKDIDRLRYEMEMNDKLLAHPKNTVVQWHGIFNAMFNHALNNKFIDTNPIDKIFIGKSSVAPKNKQTSLKNFKIWDKAARDLLDDYQYLAIRFTYLGTRKSEDYGIKLGGLIKQPNGRYLILLDDSRTRLRPNGGGMKTDGSKRYLMADEETSRLIDIVIPQSHAIAKKYGRILGPNDYLLVVDYKGASGVNKGKPWPVSRIEELFRKVSNKCGIHITPHMMRHFFATQGQIAGVPVEHMAAALGHSTSYMTQKYTHIQEEVSQSVTDKVMEIIG